MIPPRDSNFSQYGTPARTRRRGANRMIIGGAAAGALIGGGLLYYTYRAPLQLDGITPVLRTVFRRE